MLAGYSENGFVTHAFEVFRCMRDVSLLPNGNTLSSLLEVASNLNSPKLAMQIHSHVIKLGIPVGLSCGVLLDNNVWKMQLD